MDRKERMRVDLGDFEALPEIRPSVTREIKDEHLKPKSDFQDFADILGISKKKITKHPTNSDRIFSFKGIKFTLDKNSYLHLKPYSRCLKIKILKYICFEYCFLASTVIFRL